MTAGRHFDIERFERVDASSGTVLLRVAGRWHAPARDRLSAPELLLDVGGHVRNLRPLPTPDDLRPTCGPDPPMWRAAYSAPADVVASPGASYLLSTDGVVVELPIPGPARTRSAPPAKRGAPAPAGDQVATGPAAAERRVRELTQRLAVVEEARAQADRAAGAARKEASAAVRRAEAASRAALDQARDAIERARTEAREELGRTAVDARSASEIAVQEARAQARRATAEAEAARKALERSHRATSLRGEERANELARALSELAQRDLELEAVSARAAQADAAIAEAQVLRAERDAAAAALRDAGERGEAAAWHLQAMEADLRATRERASGGEAAIASLRAQLERSAEEAARAVERARSERNARLALEKRAQDLSRGVEELAHGVEALSRGGGDRDALSAALGHARAAEREMRRMMRSHVPAEAGGAIVVRRPARQRNPLLLARGRHGEVARWPPTEMVLGLVLLAVAGVAAVLLLLGVIQVIAGFVALG